ncbi:MAG: hypothetical protein JNL61_19730 [Rhizobiaceae bacterium]|nr:hypothetical protein [Rhizobiaceae bacterium]
MRMFHVAVVILLGLATIIFAFQNLGVVTMSFLGLSIRTPLALLIVIFYILGALTGGSLFALVRQSVRESRLLN